MVILTVVVYFLFPPEITFWDKIYDKCTPSEAKYQYVVRMMSSDMKKGFDPHKTTLTIDIFYDAPKELSLTITPKMLTSRVQLPTHKYKASRFLLYRKEPLKDIKKVSLKHNGKGVIVVPSLEIQEIHSPTANIAFIGKEIKNVDKKNVALLQTEGAATLEDRPIEPGLRVTASLTALEFIIFFFMAINLMIFLTVYLIPCSGESFCQDYHGGFSSSVFSGLSASTVSAFVFVIECAIHRYVIKKSILNGITICSAIRYGFLILMALIGIALGIVTALMASQNRRFPETNPGNEFFHEVYWLFAVGIAITVFFLFWISMLAIVAYLIGFFSEETTGTQPIKMSDATMRSSSDDKSSDDPSFYQTLSQNTRVKSISQYKGTSSTSTNATNVTTASTKVNKGSSADEDDAGDKYYDSLMKKHQGKVKSISQYGGFGP